MPGTLVLVLLLLVVMVGAAHSHLVVLRDTGTRTKREVGPVTSHGGGQYSGGHHNGGHHNHTKQPQKKYKRLQHSIMVQADIRSRSDQLTLIMHKYIITSSTGWPVCHDMKQGVVNQVL